MAADETLVKGAATAYKSRENLTDAFEGWDEMTDQLWEVRQAKKEARKEEAKELAEKQELAGTQLSNQIITMAPHLKAMGQDEFQEAQTKVSDMRARMNECIKNKDQECQSAIMIELNELKSTSLTRKDEYESFFSQYDNELVDTKAMPPEAVRIHEQFTNNPTRKYAGDGQYTWQILDANGQPTPKWDQFGNMMRDANGQIMFETETYSMADIADMSILRDTKNGLALNQLVQNKTELQSCGTDVNYRDYREEVKKIIPKDEKQLRSWLYGDPTEKGNFDMRGFLEDHPLLEGQYKALGVQDIRGKMQWSEELGREIEVGDGIYDENDLIDDDHKAQIIDAIMNVSDLTLVHDIVTNAYATFTHNTIIGNKNKDYHEGDNTKMGDYPTVDRVKIKEDGRKELVRKLINREFEDGKSLKEIAAGYDLGLDDKIVVTIAGEKKTMSIADAYQHYSAGNLTNESGAKSR